MSDYPILRLGDIVKPVQDRMADRKKWYFDKYIAGEHIDSGEVRIKKCGQIKGNEEVIGSAFHMCFKPGHVLYSTRRAYLRKAGIVNFEGICSNVTLVLQANEEKLLQSLLPFVLQSENFVQFAISRSIGSTNPFVKWTDLSKYRLRVPPISIQKKISQILWATEDNIEKIENLIQVAEKLKKGLLEELLTKGIGHKEFKKSELGEIPEEWNFTSIGKITSEHKQGYYTKEKYVENGIYLVRITDLNNPEIDYENMPKIEVSKKDFNAFKVEPGDFLIARSGAIGRYGIVNRNKDAVFGSYIIRFRFKDFISSEFFGLVYESNIIQSQLLRILQKGANSNINAENIKKLYIFYPPRKEQEQILKIANSMKRTISDFLFCKKKLFLLKKKLANSFLSGELVIPKEAMN